MKRLLLATALLALAACDNPKERAMPDLPAVQSNLAFTCAYEKDAIPKRDPEADQLYAHARWLKKNNLLKPDPLVYPKIERLVRIATAYGHDKANLELREMLYYIAETGLLDFVDLDVGHCWGAPSYVPSSYHPHAEYREFGKAARSDMSELDRKIELYS